jgi:hypothetical protein
LASLTHSDAERPYMRPRILAESTGAGILRAYIESSLAFMREHLGRPPRRHEEASYPNPRVAGRGFE